MFLCDFCTKLCIADARFDGHKKLQIYQEMAQIMVFADDFLSYSALCTLLNSMVGLFWSSYSLIICKDNYMTYSFFLLGIVHNLVTISMVMLPASAANQAFSMAKDTLLSLPERFSALEINLNLLIFQGLKQRKCADVV
ncbi:hypothetical protein CEXT_588791 [Caerostris extrusa]|uniref:Uncharacterized protein n=1 Tax=Caerostris extrusa TaxID=172846 RepID=A0AAV4TRW2_CAEEX|nr:hypothetical protein CEXT_588791 [Caerostris extrusa]